MKKSLGTHSSRVLRRSNPGPRRSFWPLPAEWHDIDRPFFILIIVLLLVGLVALTSASSVIAWERFHDAYFYVKHQLQYGILLGLVAMLIVSRIDYHVWRSWAVPVLVVAIVLMIGSLIPGVGFSYGGSSNWIHIGPVFFQPAELTKLALILYLASWLTNQDRMQQVSNIESGFMPFMVILGGISAFILLQRDFGTLFVIAVIGLSIYFVAGGRIYHLLGFSTVAAALLFALIRTSERRFARLTVFLNPELDPLGIGYHINQAKLAIGSGGLFGLGLGHSRQKYEYLPEVISDSIFAIIAEEMGFILSVGVIVLFLLLIFRGLKVARHAPDHFGRLLVVGITIWIGFQMFVNVGAMVGLLPLTGLPLPFISYGSSSILSLLVGAGIVLNVSRQTKAQEMHFKPIHVHSKWRK